jgi:hypothetical protein
MLLESKILVVLLSNTTSNKVTPNAQRHSDASRDVSRSSPLSPCPSPPAMSAEAPVSAANVRQLFLQAMLSRRTVSAALAKLLWRKCADAVRGACMRASAVAAY